MEIELVHKLRPIPMLRTPAFREVEIAGQTVRIHKLRARQAAVVAQRLMTSFGETLLKFWATPGSELEKVFSGERNVGTFGVFKMVLATGFFAKAIARLNELGHDIGEDHIAWYFDNVLAGNVELVRPEGDEFHGLRFASLDEMDRSGFGLSEVLDLFGDAIVLAIYPTSDDPDTDAGKSGTTSAKTKRQRPESEKKTRRGSKPNAATRKGGQSVLMSNPLG